MSSRRTVPAASLVALLSLVACMPASPSAQLAEGPAALRESRAPSAADEAQAKDQVGAYLAYRLLMRYAEGRRPESRSESEAHESFAELGLTAADVARALDSTDAGRTLQASMHPELARMDLDEPSEAVAAAIERALDGMLSFEDEAEDDGLPPPTAAEAAGLRCLDYGDCDEVPGDGYGLFKWNLAKPRPFLHSAYGDLGAHGFPEQIPANPSAPLHVPVAETAFGALDAVAVACQTDADCAALGDLRPRCMPLDGDGDGIAKADVAAPEYEACLQDGAGLDQVLDECFPGGHLGGDLTAQAGVPDTLLQSLASPDDPDAGEVSACGLAPSWSSKGNVVVAGVDEQRVFVAAQAFYDVDAGATLLRVADADGQPLGPIATVRMPDGDLEVAFDNGTRQSADAFVAGGGAFAYVPDTVTLGAQGASQPLLDFLVNAPNEAERYLSDTLSDQHVDDLWVVDLPDDLPAGIYELRADWHAQPYVDIEDENGDAWTESAMNWLYTQCAEMWTEAGAAQLAGMCSMYDYDQWTGTFADDPRWLSNPVYIRILDGEQVERFEVSVPKFRILDTQETFDDPTFQTVMMAYDTSDPNAVAACQDALQALADGGEQPELGDEPEATDCLVRSFFEGPFDDVDEDEPSYSLGFTGSFDLGPDHELVVITEVWEDDDDGATSKSLKQTNALVVAVAENLPDDLDDDGWTAAVLGVVGELLEGFIIDAGALQKPEYLGRTTTLYTYDDLVYLTHAAQAGLDPDEVLHAHDTGEYELASLQAHTFQATFDELDQGTVSVTDKAYLDGTGGWTIFGESRWGESHLIRNLQAKNPDGTWGSDSSRYELHHAVVHVR